eukprot:COSAG02_NODE_47194_length_343_cov_0.610656_1_plen_66_part_10
MINLRKWGDKFPLKGLNRSPCHPQAEQTGAHPCLGYVRPVTDGFKLATGGRGGGGTVGSGERGGGG